MTFEICIKCVELLLSNSPSRFVHSQSVVGFVTSLKEVDGASEIDELIMLPLPFAFGHCVNLWLT